MRRSVESLSKSEYDTLNGVTARCKQCNWQAKGEITFEVKSRAVIRGGLIENCHRHHLESRASSPIGFQHNQFSLLKGNKEVGYAVVASEAIAGFIY